MKARTVEIERKSQSGLTDTNAGGKISLDSDEIVILAGSGEELCRHRIQPSLWGKITFELTVRNGEPTSVDVHETRTVRLRKSNQPA